MSAQRIADISMSGQKSTDEVQFAVNLYKAVAKVTPSSENIVLCPCSVEWLLATLYPGLRGDTGKELSRVLHLRERSLDELTDVLRSATKTPKDVVSYRLHTAHGVFVDNNVSLRSEYSNIVSTVFDDPVHTVPFKMDHQEAYRALICFMEAQTNGHISVLSDYVNASNIKLMLLSAVDFKVQWEDPFHMTMSSEDSYAFTKADGTEIVMPFMYQCPWNHYFKYKDGTQIAKLEQRGGQGAVMLVLPPEDVPLSEFEQALTALQLQRMFNEKDRYPAGILLPRFRLETEVDLVRIMKSLGANKLSGSEGNWLGISDDKSIGVSAKFAQRAVIEVDEIGAVDLGVTQMDHILSWLFEFQANRPFLFTVWHTETQIPITIARVANPSLIA